MTALAALAAAIALTGGPASVIPPSASVHPSFSAGRATGRPVLCFPGRSWARFVRHWYNAKEAAGVDGLYLWQWRAIAFPADHCWAFAHWRRAYASNPLSSAPYLHPDRQDLALDIWELGHELTHDEQYVARRPFSEHEADCRGLAKFGHLKARLGINTSLAPPFTKAELHC